MDNNNEKLLLRGNQPFVSYDAPDANGHRAEVYVVTGTGTVNGDVSKKDNKPSGIFDSSVTFYKDADYSDSGWVNSTEIMEKLQQAQSLGLPLEYRIEHQRKQKVDRTIPIKELRKDAKSAKENISKRLVGVRMQGDKDWVYDRKTILTNPEHDIKYIQQVARSAFGQDYDNAKDSGGKPQPSPKNSFEPTPFYTFNNRDEVNPGSIAVSVPSTVAFFLMKYVREHDIKLDSVQELTKKLLKVCNRLQLAIYNGKLDNPDLSLGSHTRARALVFGTIENAHPLTNGDLESEESLQKWLKTIYNYSLSLWKWSIKTVEKM